MSNAWKKILNLAERAGSTFAEQFFMVLLATGAISSASGHDFAVSADRAGFAAVMSIATSLLTYGWTKQSVVVDNILRILKTGLQVFVGDIVASHITSLIHTDWKTALAAAIAVMGPAALKVLAATALPSLDGGALIPVALAPDSVSSDDIDPAHLDYGDTGSEIPVIDPADLEYDEPAADQPVVLPPHTEANLTGNGTGPLPTGGTEGITAP